LSPLLLALLFPLLLHLRHLLRFDLNERMPHTVIDSCFFLSLCLSIFSTNFAKKPFLCGGPTGVASLPLNECRRAGSRAGSAREASEPKLFEPWTFLCISGCSSRYC
jgi:hypothetical protein